MSCEIKICGLTNPHDAIKAHELGADYLGFILYDRSPRYIDPMALKKLCSQLPSGAKAVGVFVNAERATLLSIIEQCGLAAVQLHGDEDLNDYLPLPVPVWKAVRIGPDTKDLPEDAGLAERLVVDTAVKGMYGGTGQQVDLAVAANIAMDHRVMLGGGMDPDNVSAAIAQVKPLGVDTATGVEAAPGVKDHAKLEAFFKAVAQGS